MHLKKIKLAGFKSFVEPTTIHLQAKLAGIVGPNGCGKSNIIDAVRWVMGESSAKQLRSEAMSDVIFNGSAERKPVGQASIELIFDNTDAGIGGEYAQYSEIAIRREIERDGGSNYYLNGTNCRRRDIVDVFLGTGLGSNSYAIIEQGTISQFVEAKPDELRLYLEEAAGISKYKERRRETENRIKHTRDNLARLNDIRLELEQQIAGLKNQVNAAERYKKLKQEERQAKAELHALHWQQLQKQLTEINELIKGEETKLEDKNAAKQSYDAKIDAQREKHHDVAAVFNAAQENYYRVGADVARLEQQLQHERERKKTLSLELTKLEQTVTETAQHKQNDQEQAALLQEELNKLTDAKPQMAETLHALERDLQAKTRDMREFQQGWDAFQVEAANIERHIEVEQTKIQHIQRTISSEEQRLEKIREELANFAVNTNLEEIANLEQKQALLQEQNEKLHHELKAKHQEIAEQRKTYEKLTQELNASRHEMQILAGKCASLESLQEAALGKSDALKKKWLQEKQLTGRPHLLEELQVESKWEKAVEIVLAGYLEALCIEDLKIASEWTNSLPESHVMLFDSLAGGDNYHDVVGSSNAINMPTLLSKITTKLPLVSLLYGVHVADTLEQALTYRPSLKPYESIVTVDGVWLGANWLCLSGKLDPHSGVIHRARELQEVKKISQKQQEQVAKQEADLQQQQQFINQKEKELQEIQHQLRDITSVLGKAQGEISAKKRHNVYLAEQQQNLHKDLTNHQEILHATQEDLKKTQATWQDAVNKREIVHKRRQELEGKREKLQKELTSLQEQSLAQRKATDANTMRLELLQTQRQYLANNLDRAVKKLKELEIEHTKLTKNLEDSEKPIFAKEQELEQKITARLDAEKALQIAKQKVSEDENLLRELEKKRAMIQEESQSLRVRLEKIRIEAQELKTKQESQIEYIAELNYVLDELLPALSNEASVSEWEEKIMHLASRIERLGPINLAAIGEFEKQKARKDYLDAQNQDLLDALTTLEGAIDKIDGETRGKFQDIFAKVNQRFQLLFPNIFNGGKAYLELVGDNLLEAGVTILAQPPGKRNSSIHLLSGGEKALTAIALIFAIFQLNPAPFCMLDEVDAPLDDVNVSRFCNLVKEIASHVQLIFVSHNKLTLEMADQLTGVTMQEPGVSRIVEVDVQKALEWVRTE